jgi:hypothetical protein
MNVNLILQSLAPPLGKLDYFSFFCHSFRVLISRRQITPRLGPIGLHDLSTLGGRRR